MYSNSLIIYALIILLLKSLMAQKLIFFALNSLFVTLVQRSEYLCMLKICRNNVFPSVSECFLSVNDFFQRASECFASVSVCSQALVIFFLVVMNFFKC